jgi:hypothetical protein
MDKEKVKDVAQSAGLFATIWLGSMAIVSSVVIAGIAKVRKG